MCALSIQNYEKFKIVKNGRKSVITINYFVLLFMAHVIGI